MLKNERQNKIIETVRSKKSVTVSALADMLYVSDATVRRDLRELELSGALLRSHGGALLPQGVGTESPGLVREMQNTHKKRKMAELARDFLRADMTLFIDSSSSAGAVIPYISNETVITNGIRNCLKLMERGAEKVFLCPGAVSRYSDAALGSDAVNYISGFCADLCIISCGGLSSRGITEASREQASFKRRMLENSQVRLLLCDSSKFEHDCMSVVCGFDSIDYIITDSLPCEKTRKVISDSGCEIITPDCSENGL